MSTSHRDCFGRTVGALMSVASHAMITRNQIEQRIERRSGIPTRATGSRRCRPAPDPADRIPAQPTDLRSGPTSSALSLRAADKSTSEPTGDVPADQQVGRPRARTRRSAENGALCIKHREETVIRIHQGPPRRIVTKQPLPTNRDGASTSGFRRPRHRPRTTAATVFELATFNCAERKESWVSGPEQRPRTRWPETETSVRPGQRRRTR